MLTPERIADLREDVEKAERLNFTPRIPAHELAELLDAYVVAVAQARVERDERDDPPYANHAGEEVVGTHVARSRRERDEALRDFARHLRPAKQTPEGIKP